MSSMVSQHRSSTLSAAERWLRPRIPSIVSTISVLVGVMILAGAVLRRDTFGDMVTLPAGAASEAVAAVAGWVLLRLAHGLRRRKRAEWRIAVASCGALVLTDLLCGERRPVEAALTAVLLAALVIGRKQFVVRGDPGGRWFAVRAASQLLVVGAALGLAMLYVPGRVAAGTGFWPRLREIGLSLFGLGGRLAIVDDRWADVFHAVLFAFGLTALVALITIGLRPPEPVAALTPDDETRLRDLLRQHGRRDSLGYFALRRDKAVVWSPSAKAAVTYRVVRGVALASGDPIGDPEAWPGAIRAWGDLAEHHGWTTAVLGCSELGARTYRREVGLSTIALGDEAVVHTAGFSLDGRAMRGVRQPCARLERAGYTVQVRRVRDCTSTELDQLRGAATAWRADPVERGFSMALSRLGDAADPDCVIVTAHFDGTTCGLLHFVPWSGTGISLDLMRRDRAADNGVNELMIASLLQRAYALGIEDVSLNFAVFRDALERGARVGAGPVSRLWRRILLLASRWWQIDSLYRFNDKFRPEWMPRFFSYQRARDLPRIARAALEAEAFLGTPLIVDRLLGRTVAR